jgi:hypothetical protein
MTAPKGSEPPYISLADYAAGFDAREQALPAWLPPGAAAPLVLDAPLMRARVEDIVDTVVALQRADWLEDGVFVGPSSMPTVYDHVLQGARTLKVAVPPAIVAGAALSSQGIYGTDARAYLYLSTYFFGSATESESRFLTGRFLGLSASHLVTANTLYALLVDHGGLREMASRSVGPVLEVVLAPLSLGLRMALSRWHRFAEVGADRAGLLCNDDLRGAGKALLRMSLGGDRGVEPDAYLAQLDAVRAEDSPAKFAQLLADKPWTHKRMRALALFHRSQAFADAGGTPASGPLLSTDALNAQTLELMGVR